jgi:hypothetical protein
LSWRWLDFNADLRGFLVAAHDPIYGRDGFKRDLGDSGRENLSGAISWLIFCTLKRRCRTLNGATARSRSQK